MADVYDQLIKASELISRIMESEGVLTDEDIELMDSFVKESKDDIEFLRAYFSKAVSHERFWKEELDRITKKMKPKINRAQSQQAWAKMRALEFLQARDALGQSTTIKGLAHIKTSYSLNGPEDIEAWPEAYRVERSISKPDRLKAIRDLKNGIEIPGLELQSSQTAVFK